MSEGVETRLDRLESLVEQQQATIEDQQETIQKQRERIAELDADDKGDVMMNRRTALQAGGILGLLGVGAGAASADAQGSVGTSSDPLNTVHVEELNGGVTGNSALTSLAGNGLTIAGGSLDIESGAVGSGELASDSVTVAGNSVSLGGSTGVDYVDLGDTGSSFPIPNSDIANASVTVAGNSVSLGGSTGIAHGDLSSVASNDHHTRPSAGSGLTENGDTFDLKNNISVETVGFGSSWAIGYSSSNQIQLAYEGAYGGIVGFLPNKDKKIRLGKSDRRFKALYAHDGTINTSDARLKENVADISDGLERVDDIRPVSYEWTDEDNSETRLGFIAQELDDAVPEAVNHPNDEDGYLGVTYDMVLPVAVDAIQTQQDRIESLEAESESLQAENEQLRERNANLESRLERIETELGIDATASRQGVADD